jgi:hypothetical protein
MDITLKVPQPTMRAASFSLIQHFLISACTA